MSPAALPVLVIGAGPSGLTAALSLVKNIVPIRVIDKAIEPHKMARGVGQHSRTLEVWRFLGVIDDMCARGSPIKPMTAYKLPGGTEVERVFGLSADRDETPDKPYRGMGVSQFLTETVLRDHLARHGVHVELGTEPTSMEQDSDGVTVHLKKTDKDGNESTETVRAAYVVGADGAKGVTRKLIGATFEGQTRDAEGMVWTECEIEGEGITRDSWHTWSQLGTAMVIASSKAEGGWNLGMACSTRDPIDLVDPVKFVEFFREFTGRSDIVFKDMSPPRYWKPNMRMVNKFQEGRVFIVGDAAHVHSPTGGQGLNTSIQDSFNLGWKIGLAHKGLAAPILLESYNIERLPVVAQMLVATSNLYTHVMTKPADDPSRKAVGFSQWRKEAFRLLNVNYRFSPLALDARGDGGLTLDEMLAHAYEGYGPDGGVRAGDRAPQAPGLVDARGTTTSLFDVLKPNMHTVLFFTSGASGEGEKIAAVVKEVQSCPAETAQVVIISSSGVPASVGGAIVYHDKEGYAVRGLKVEGDTPKVVVVRPDGYIGAFVYDAVGVRDYFARILNL